MHNIIYSSILKIMARLNTLASITMEDASKYIFGTIQEGVVLLDEEGRILFMNPAACRMFNVDSGREEDWLNKPLAGLGVLLPEGIWENEAVKKEALFRRGDYEINLILNAQRKDGRIILCLERKTRGNIKCLAPDEIYAETLDTMIGIPPSMLDKARLLARQDLSIVIQGESGTGKDLLARAIHRESPRRNGQFVVVDVSSLPASLIESELFGYEPGAFTGARSEGRVGKFELAEGGTVLLDEAGDIPLELQIKLLRVIDDKKVVRLGGKRPKPVDFRLISCSNRNLKELVKKGMLREDLFYRLHGAEIHLLPLRKRMEYFDDLVGLFLRKHSRDARVALPEETRNAMRKYPWPGNIRELEKAIQYLLAIKPDGIILPQDLPGSIALSDIEEKNLPLKDIMQAHERFVLVHALSRNKNNITRTARDLKITRMTLQVKMKKLGIKSNNGYNDNHLYPV